MITRRHALKSGAALAVAGITTPYVVSQAKAAAKHRLTFDHTFGAAAKDAYALGLII